MSIITLEVLFILFLTIVNGVFAMSEIAVVSARKTRLQQWAESGNRKARLALDVAYAPEDFLSTVQVGITLIGVFAGAFGGATIAQHLSAALASLPLLAPFAETMAVGLVVIAITYLSLILGELLPKRIALSNPETIATLVAGPMRVLSRVSAPAVWFLSTSTKVLLWLFRVRPGREPSITEDEIRILIRQGTEAGVVEREEQDIVDRVLRLGTRRSSSIMTPRKDLVVLYASDSPDHLERKITVSGHAVYPLCEDTLDNVLGVVRTQDVLGQVLGGKKVDLKAVLHQPIFLPESVLSLKLLREFRKSGNDTALLLDEYGGLQGLITATDILKSLLGGVSYSGTPKAVHQPDGSWLIDGMLPVDEFMDTLRIGHLPGEEGHSVETAGGFMMVVFGRIPSEGDEADWDKFRFKVIDMDGLRVDKVLATAITRKGNEPTEGV